MSTLQVTPADRGVASPLMSNNPFRNKIASSQTQAAPPRPVRPISTNPFLDSNEFQKLSASTVSAVPAEGINGATDLFASMSMNGPQQSPERRARPNMNVTNGRPENMPPRSMRGPPPNHRPMPSEEERRRRGMGPRRGTEIDVFADPSDSGSIRERRSMRRNSESSVRDKPNSLDPEDEKKRRERKDRDSKNGKYKPSKKLDIIDKLDVTSIYGTGLFHHDGPFDACNPHRNKKRHKYAPIHAFPKDSANMMIGGGGPRPEKPQMDYDRFHGYGQEAHIDYNEAAVVDEYGEYVRRPLPARSASFNPTAQDTVHGKETAGLGTSTFLEGAPASRLAIERRDSEMNETQQQQTSIGGLSRKKSLAQKIRGVRNGPRVQSPDSDRPPNSPLNTGKSDVVTNPFFKDYDNEYERKGQQIAQAEEQATDGRPRALSSPRPLSSSENDNAETAQESKSSGFLGRMKSLKKTKSRYERRDVS